MYKFNVIYSNGETETIIGDTYTECARKQAAFVKKAMKRGGNILEVTGVSINK